MTRAHCEFCQRWCECERQRWSQSLLNRDVEPWKFGLSTPGVISCAKEKIISCGSVNRPQDNAQFIACDNFLFLGKWSQVHIWNTREWRVLTMGRTVMEEGILSVSRVKRWTLVYIYSSLDATLYGRGRYNINLYIDPSAVLRQSIISNLFARWIYFLVYFSNHYSR